MTEIAAFDRSSLLTLTADIVAAHVSNNSVSVGDLPSLIVSVHGAIAGLGDTRSESAPAPTPAVPVRLSVTPDYLVCLEDGRKFKTMKRHLMSKFQLTPDEYRAKWNLPADYPMVAPAYAATRSALAKSLGLGRKPVADGGLPASRMKAPAEDDSRSAPKRAKPPAPRGSRKTLHLTLSDKS